MNSSTRDSCGKRVPKSHRSSKAKNFNIQRVRSDMAVDDTDESIHDEGSGSIELEESEAEDMRRKSSKSKTGRVQDAEEDQDSVSGSQDGESRQGDSDCEDDAPEGVEHKDGDVSPSEYDSEMKDKGTATLETKQKKRTPGIIYLSYIPEGLNVAKTRELLGEFGEVKRMYFEPVKKLGAKNRPLHRFREGWVEFAKKKDAKRVAELLNAKPVGGKRRAPYRDCLWSIKYLHRFRWTHLAERLTYEKAVKDQRMRTEIAKAKREAKFYAKTLEQSIRRRKKRQNGEISDDNPSRIKLRKTDKEIREEKATPAANETVDKGLLMSIFSKD